MSSATVTAYFKPEPAHPKALAFIKRVDDRLSSTPDRGHRAAFLNDQLTTWERNRAHLERWARCGIGRNPIGEGATVFDVDWILASLQRRLDGIEASARADIVLAHARAL